MSEPAGFEPPPYPYDRLDELREVADRAAGRRRRPVDRHAVRPAARGRGGGAGPSGAERGYPPSVGTPAFREAAAGWLARRFGVTVDPAHLAACVGTKEFVAGVPHWLRLRTPGPRHGAVPADQLPVLRHGRHAGRAAGRCRTAALDAIDPDDAARALCLWVNSPANPTGEV